MRRKGAFLALSLLVRLFGGSARLLSGGPEHACPLTHHACCHPAHLDRSPWPLLPLGKAQMAL